MKLIEALKIVGEEQPAHMQAFSASLICGFTPLHLTALLNAHLRLRLPDRKIDLLPSFSYGDLLGNLRTASAPDACFVVVEWGDLDARLGTRGLGSWAPSAFDDIVSSARNHGYQIEQAIKEKAENVPVIVSFPTLPLPPISFMSGWQAGALELELKRCTASAALELALVPNVRVLNSERLDSVSPISERLDVKSEIVSGFPYRLPHASTLADLLSRLAAPVTPKKGLITDLDDTLWDGILGEIGAASISWDLDHRSHMHGAYQRFLHALSEAGILIGVASKNSGDEVEKAFERKDLLLPPNCVFPIEAHWNAKSDSVRRIIHTWNVGPDAVVFIDDNPMELAEVKAAHPEVECILFPKDDPQAIDDLLRRLRDIFGKDRLSDEDAIRRESLRRSVPKISVAGNHNGGGDEFLKQAEAELTLSFSKNPIDPRSLELVNKTNQFNLNGVRHTESSWKSLMSDPQTVFLMASYRDKYGPLGKIAVIAGQRQGSMILIESWVMSCRAFSRRIEYRCLQELFEKFQVDKIEFDFRPTSKNGPMSDFLRSVSAENSNGRCSVTREQFLKSGCKTFHEVLETRSE